VPFPYLCYNELIKIKTKMTVNVPIQNGNINNEGTIPQENSFTPIADISKQSFNISNENVSNTNRISNIGQSQAIDNSSMNNQNQVNQNVVPQNPNTVGNSVHLNVPQAYPAANDQPQYQEQINTQITNDSPVTPVVKVKKKKKNKIITILLLVWLAIGGYYFLGGNNVDIFQEKAVELKGQLMDGSLLGANLLSDVPIIINEDVSTENGISMNEISSINNNPRLDSVDEMFINGKVSDLPNNNSVKTINKTINVLDLDGDGLNNDIEKFAGTDPYIGDTDKDGLSDYQEMMIYHTDPLKKDTDGDGVEDGEELKQGTNPNN